MLASQGRLLLGPYSRFQWHHPGPLYFYAMAPFYALSGSRATGLNVGALMINVAGLALVTGMLRGRASARLTAAASAALALLVLRVPDLLVSPWNAHVPVVAAVNGFALGGGLELALACDFILASENARLGLVEAKLGLVPGFGGVARLSRRVGRAMASELLFTAGQVPAAEALRIRLVNRVVPLAELLTEARRVAGLVASQGPLAVATAKRLLREGENADLRVANVLEQQSFGLLFASADMREGVTAFQEKRPPAFAGR